MASNGLAEAFARLSVSDSRLTALEALIQELTPYEWRFVHSLTSARTFQFDIIGRLPVELVSHIFSYLDTSTPWRLQCVSQSWYEKLRSLSVIKSSLDSWYAGTINLQGVNLDFCKRKARSIHAFRGGARFRPPNSSIKISPQSVLSRPFLVGDSLVWCVPESRQVIVANLRSWAFRVLVDPSRGEIGELHAADDLVAFSARVRGLVFVGELNGQAPLKSFRLQAPTQKLTLTCRHRTVACAMHFEDCTNIYIWNYDTSQGRSFQINRAALQLPMSNLNTYGLLLQPDLETVILCQYSTAARSDASGFTFLHWRFTYAGQCLHGVEQALEMCHDKSEARFGNPTTSLSFIPASHDGTYMLQCNGCVLSLQYDERTQALTSPRNPRLYPPDRRDCGNVFWWKDVFVEAGTKDEIIVHRDTASLPNFNSHIACTFQCTQPSESKDLLINDRYIVRPYRNVFYIFCYDHTVQFPAIEPGTNGTIRGVGLWEIIQDRFPSVRECAEETQ